MFDLEEFKDTEALETIAKKLNKYRNKNKPEKIIDLINELHDLLDKEDYQIPITYILSVLAEEDFSYISPDTIENIKSFLKSPQTKLKINSFIIIGFAMINDSNYIKHYLKYFIKNLNNNNSDIKENIYYFLQEIVKKEPQVLCKYKEELLDSLSIEKKSVNLYSLLEFIKKCNNLKFNEFFWFKKILKSLTSKFSENKIIKISDKIKEVCKYFYPFLKAEEIEELRLDEIYKTIDKNIIKNKIKFEDFNKGNNISLKDYVKIIKNSRFSEEEICFYVKIDKEVIIYEMEKNKLLSFFEQDNKLSKNLIKDFLYVIDSELELKTIIKTLLKLGLIKGYFSELGYFYPYNYVKSEFKKPIREEGVLELVKYNYLPIDLIKTIIKDIAASTNETILTGRNKKSIYSLKRLNQKINFKAAKGNIVDLSSYRELLTKKSFIKLIKNLTKDYLTDYRKGTMLLTNLGLMKIKNEIENSKILGYLSIPKISVKLNINKILLMDVLDDYLDTRGGVFNKDKDTFYYTKFLNDKIEKINQLSEKERKEAKITELTNELNIPKDLILAKIDENLKLIGEEIKSKEEIRLSVYLEKTGMSEAAFFDFINNLNTKYLKKGDLLIFNEFKIREAEIEIKNILIEKTDSEDYILLSDIDATSSLVENLLKELQEEKKVQGILYKDIKGAKFYTRKGIENLMLQEGTMFSFDDLFYGKVLSEQEKTFLKSILEDLINSKKLKGNFDVQNSTFSSYEIIFAQDYNGVLSEFEKLIINYNRIFESEFLKIKKILKKRTETIFPQEIQEIQEIIDRINNEYVRWRSGLEAFIRRANGQLLKKQGYTLKKYRKLKSSTIKEGDVKLFEEDPEVIDLLDEFKSWIKLFNKVELKYGNVLFYQKRLINNPEKKENERKLTNLLKELNLY